MPLVPKELPLVALSLATNQRGCPAFTFDQLHGVSTIECHWSGQYTLIVAPNFGCATVSVSLLWFQLADPRRPGLAYLYALAPQLAVMHSLVRFANIVASGRFTTADLYRPALDALGLIDSQYLLASFRYDLSRLRAKGLVERIPHSPRYQLVGTGYSICVAFLKLFEKIYAPLTAGLVRKT